MRLGKNALHDVRTLESQREHLARADVIRAREERAQRLHHRCRRELEIALAVRAVVGHVAHELRGLADRLPVDAVVVGDDRARVEVRQGRKHLCKQMHRSRIVGVVQHRGPDVRGESVLLRQIVERLEEHERLLIRKALHELRERLRHDAHGLRLVAVARELRPRGIEHFHRFRDLSLIRRSIEADKRGDRADLRLRGVGRRMGRKSERAEK